MICPSTLRSRFQMFSVKMRLGTTTLTPGTVWRICWMSRIVSPYSMIMLRVSPVDPCPSGGFTLSRMMFWLPSLRICSCAS